MAPFDALCSLRLFLAFVCASIWRLQKVPKRCHLLPGENHAFAPIHLPRSLAYSRVADIEICFGKGRIARSQ